MKIIDQKQNQPSGWRRWKTHVVWLDAAVGALRTNTHTPLHEQGLMPGLIKFGILFLDAKFAKNKNSKLPKLSGCLYVWVYDLAASRLRIAIPTGCR
jgi:hypothetical protein